MTIKRYKTDDELTTDEHLRVEQAAARGEPAPKFETAEYREARADALRYAGLDEEADEVEAAIDRRALGDLDNDELAKLSTADLDARLRDE